MTLLPVAAGFFYAVLYSLGYLGYGSEGLTLSHYSSLLSEGVFFRSFLMTLWTASLTVLLSVWLGLWLSASTYSQWLYAPLGIPALVMAFVVYFFWGGSGFFVRFLLNFGLVESSQEVPVLVQDSYGFGIVFAQVFMATPFFALLFKQIRQQENMEKLEHLAATIGATRRQIQSKVVVPLLLFRAKSSIAVYFLFAFGSYEIPLVLGSQSRPMLSVLTVKKLQKFNLADIPQAYAICVLYVLLPLLLLTFFNKAKSEQ